MSSIPNSIKSLTIGDSDNFMTRSQYRDFLVNNLKNLSNWEDIDQTLNGAGTLDFIIDMISALQR